LYGCGHLAASQSWIVSQVAKAAHHMCTFAVNVDLCNQSIF